MMRVLDEALSPTPLLRIAFGCSMKGCRHMPSDPISQQQVLALLTAAPPRIAVLTDGLTAEQLRATPGPGEWSASAVLAHMRSCADVWGDCMMSIITHEHPTIRAINPTTWIKGTDYLEQEFHPSLQVFAAQRAALLDVLERLEPKSWARSATITGAGAALERSVLSYAQWLARHEQPHIKQIQRITNTLRASAG
jgi:DinB superfamily